MHTNPNRLSMERRNMLCNAVQASLLIRAVLSTDQVGINPHTPGGGKVLMSNTFCAETGPNYQGDYCSNETGHDAMHTAKHSHRDHPKTVCWPMTLPTNSYLA